ncbi:MAG: hypothetical protein ACOCZE_07230, partial [Planctomycetota bacterium]
MKNLGSKWLLVAMLILLASGPVQAQQADQQGQAEAASMASALIVGFSCLGAAICTIGGGYA